MAQVLVFGHVTGDLEVKKSHKDSTYVCFYLREQLGKGRTQSNQVWAWNGDVSRLIDQGVKKGSLIWLTGTQQLVDSTTDQGKIKTKLLKVYLTNWGFIPRWQKGHTEATNELGIIADRTYPPMEVVDGDRVSLPE